MKRNLLNIFKYLIFLGLGIGLLFLAFRGIDFHRMVDGLKKVNYAWVVLAIAMMIPANLSRAYRWNMLIQPLGYHPKVSNTFWAIMAGYMANLALPRMGEVTRCGSLNQTDKIPIETLIGTVIVERTFDVVMLAFSIALTAFLEYRLLGGFIYSNIVGPMLAKITALLSSATFLVIASIFILAVVSGMVIIYRNRHRIAIFNTIFQLLLNVWKGMATVARMKNKGLFVAHTAFIWVMYFMMSYVCFFAIPATSQLGFTAGLFTLVLGGIGMTAPVQGGVGVYHLLVSKGLMLFGVSAVDGLLYATLVHTMQTMMMILLGSIGLLVIFMEKKKNKQVHGTS